MQSFELISQERWSMAREQLRKRFSALTEDDLTLVPGREESLLEAVARKTGRSRREVVDAFDAVGMFRAS